MARIRAQATKPWKFNQPFGLKELLAYECPWAHMQEEHTAELAEPWCCRTCSNTGQTLYGYCHCDYGKLARDADIGADNYEGEPWWKAGKWG